MTMFNHTTAPVRRSGWLSELRVSLRERRQAKADRRALEAELASYRTPAEVEDLFAAIRTQDDPTADEMRRILFANRQTHELTRTAA